MIMHFIILLNVVFVIQFSLMKSDDSLMRLSDNQKLIQCRVCQEMFPLEFDFAKLLNDQEVLGRIGVGNEVMAMGVILSKDKVEFMAKEISMQYFFKGGESLMENLMGNDKELNSCKVINSKNEKCQMIKMKLCESILGFENYSCKNTLQNKLSNFSNNNNDNDKHNKNSLKKMNTKNIFNFKSNQEPNANFITNQEQNQNFKTNKELNQNYQNNYKNNFQNNIQINPTLSNHNENTQDNPYNNISLLQMSPEYISQNFDSVPKSHWQPPKPVLLQNFESSIGVQLKEISVLTTEIAKYEKRLKELKQQLANKLEIAQSNYNVIQKTLVEISKMVNQPNLPNLIKSPSDFTEDDWDSSAKPKFLN